MYPARNPIKKGEMYKDHRVVFEDDKSGSWKYKIYKGTRKVHEAKNFQFLLGAAKDAKEWIDKSTKKNPHPEDKDKRRRRRAKSEKRKEKKKKERGYSRRRRYRKNPDKLIHTSKTDPFDIRLYDYGDGKFWYQIYDPAYKMIVTEDHEARSERGAAQHAQRVIDNELFVLNPKRKNPGDRYRVQVKGNYFSLETGRDPIKQILIVEARSKDEARKKAASRMTEKARSIGYEFEGRHRDFKAEKINSHKPGSPKSKSSRTKNPSAKELIEKARKLWDQYVEKPGKRRLKIFMDHLGKMERSAAKSVKKEFRKAKRAATAEAKRLKMKL